MKQIIFTQTQSGDRTNIMSSFQLWSKDKFLEQAFSDKNYGRYRYGYVDDGWVSLLKDMSLEEFHSVFSSTEIQKFTPEMITDMFKKEISEVYGEHKLKAQIKTLTVKQLERGRIYEDLSGVQYLYLGKIRKITIKDTGAYNGKSEEILEGHGFKYLWRDKKEFKSEDIPNVEVLKGVKKLIESNRENLILESEYELVKQKTLYGSYNLKYKLELL